MVHRSISGKNRKKYSDEYKVVVDQTTEVSNNWPLTKHTAYLPKLHQSNTYWNSNGRARVLNNNCHLEWWLGFMDYSNISITIFDSVFCLLDIYFIFDLFVFNMCQRILCTKQKYLNIWFLQNLKSNYILYYICYPLDLIISSQTNQNINSYNKNLFPTQTAILARSYFTTYQNVTS